jgi:hypothetical protein
MRSARTVPVQLSPLTKLLQSTKESFFPERVFSK